VSTDFARALEAHAGRASGAALVGGGRSWSYAELDCEVAEFAALLRARGVRVLGTLLDNGPEWVVADLAALRAGVVHVPLPVFFTPAQLGHALAAAGVDTLLARPHGAPAHTGAPAQPCRVAQVPLALLPLAATPAPLPAGTAKITFTSGTTGTPKGVCLAAGAMAAVAQGLTAATAALAIRRHLCVLPLPVLLENIAGVMAPLFAGASCIVPPLAEVGLSGSSRFDVARFQAAVARHRPHSLIVLPQMLRAWAGHLQQGGQRAPEGLRLVAVGGAAVGARLLAAARAVGIPAFEGYGLSEGASVQTLNLPGADRPGSAGRALPHARLRVAADGELEIAGSLFAGYLGEPAPPDQWWPTGDLGDIDADGFVHVRGRKKHVLITAFGRNVSPEWVETTLAESPAIAHAAVFGEGRIELAAVLWPRHDALPDVALQAAVAEANARLPDYARVGRWVRAAAAFSPESGLSTANGRPQRAAIEALHADALGTASATAP
jgi:long-subunit acyl-CoA synthetase (AMP-forming)